MASPLNVTELQNEEETYIEEAENFLAFTGAAPCKPNPVFILVLGMTGSGKSSFIARCTGKNAVTGHDLVSCTRSLAIFNVDYEDYSVYLIDTPGFNDTSRSDIDTLTGIAYYLGVSYANRGSIGGLIYLHRISDNRLTGTAARNIAMFKALSGESTYSNVAIVTTMWDGTDQEDARRRESQLISNSNAFADIIRGGAKMFRHRGGTGLAEGGKASAFAVVSHLIERYRLSPVTLQIQSEMVDEEKPLRDTQAASILLKDLEAAKSEIHNASEEAREGTPKAEQTHNSETAESSSQLRDESMQKEAHADADIAALSSTLRQIHLQEEHRILNRLGQMERSWQERVDAKLSELEMAKQMANAQAKTDLHIEALKADVDRLTKTIESKKKANAKVKTGLRSGILSGLASGAASGVIGAVATGAIAAGLICIVS